ncbi:MAG: toxic anion resistance protein [Clostridium sp.]
MSENEGMELNKENLNGYRTEEINRVEQNQNGNMQNMNNMGQNYNGNMQNMNNMGQSYNENMQNVNNVGQGYNGNMQNMNNMGQNYNGNMQNMNNMEQNYNGNMQNMNNMGQNYNGNMQNMNNMGQNYNGNMQNMNNMGQSYNGNIQNMNSMGQNYNGNMQNMNNMGQNYNENMQSMNNMGQGYNGMMQMDNAEIQGSNEIDMNSITEYKRALRNDREVQSLTSEVNIENPNSIIMFGQGASEEISKVSDQLLNSMKAVKSEEASEMLTNLTKLMDKFDVKELEGNEKQGVFAKLFKGVGETVAKLFQKYDTMGMEVEKIYVLLKRYENDIKESNANLKKLYDANIHFYRLLEKYIVAGEMAVEEVDNYIIQIDSNPAINQEQKQMMTQKLQVAKDMLSQRVYDLQIAENVAIQAAPMIQTIQMSNFNLMRKINSSFIVTLPIFKQCLAQAIILKRQEIQAKSIKQLDDKTNELIMRNAQSTARQSVEIAKMSSGSSIAIGTLEKSYETIMKGIEDTKAIQEANRQERVENSKRLEVLKHNMKKNISN